MTEKPKKSDATSSETSGIRSTEVSSTTAGDYKIGPGRPPRHGRWKKGCRSPNPRGRPRKDRSTGPDLKKLFEQALIKKVSVTRGGRKVLMTRVEIGFEQLLTLFAKGDARARRDVLQYADELGIDLLAEHKSEIEEAINESDEAILDRYVARRIGSAAVAPADRVTAPPELLDDDEYASSETETRSSPKPQAKVAIPGPTPEPGKNYPKPFSQMTPLQKQIYYPEWWKEHGEASEKQRLEQQRAAAMQDQAGVGPGRPPPGGRSVTTGKPT